jgi:hypothetical protein
MSQSERYSSLASRSSSGDGETDNGYNNLWHRNSKVYLQKRPTKGPIQKPVDYSSLLCGLAAGVAQSAVFNPYDRALYLSVKYHRPFLNRSNWKSPYTGFVQSLGGRALAGGLYFPMEHFCLRLINAEETQHPALNFVAGTLAGTCNAILLNPLTAIKYKTWGRESNRGMVKEATRMLRKAGNLRPFYFGLMPTIYRDAVFGGCYTWLRLQIQWWMDLDTPEQYKGNFVAAGLATILSGPFNYARNVQYATSSRQVPPSTTQVLHELMQEVRQTHGVDKLRLLQNRLRIGWGTFRVALGMAFAHAVYDTIFEYLKP